MAEAETLAISARIEERVIHVGENVIHVGENAEVINKGVQDVRVTVAGMKDKLDSAHTDVQGVHNDVSLINTGDFFFSSLATEGRPSAFSIRCNGNQRRDTGGAQAC